MTGAWSAVIFWHSLEHLRQPVRALRHAADLLVPGGVLIIAVPNAASLQARLFGDRWLALDLPRHLVHITPPALLSQLTTWGSGSSKSSYLRGGQVLFGWLHGLVGRLPGHPDLYDAIRRTKPARLAQSPAFRLYTLRRRRGRASPRPGRHRHRSLDTIRRHHLRTGAPGAEGELVGKRPIRTWPHHE